MNCIDLAITAANGRLTQQEIMDAFEQEGKIRELLISQGKTDNLDMRVARIIERNAMEKKAEAARMKRQIAQNILVRPRLDAQVKAYMDGGYDAATSILNLMEGAQGKVAGSRRSAYSQAQAYEARWSGSLTATVERERPHVMRLLANKDFDNAVTRELWELRDGGTPGSTKNSDAAWLAKTLKAHMEMARTELNSLGAGIGKLDGYAGPQVHDDLAMAKVSATKWADDIMPMLDLDRSFPDATSEAEARGIVESIYDTIITGVSNGSSPLLTGKRVGPANLATKLGKHRVLHFKDADAAIKYRDMYGRGSTIQGIFGTLQHQAKMAGAMDMFGPNPEAMIGSIAARLQLDLKAKIAGMKPGKARDAITAQMNELASSGGSVARLKAALDIVTGLSSRPVSVTGATVAQNIRTLQGMAKLGGAVLTAMPTDTVTMASAAMFRGQGFWHGMARTLSEFANRKDGKQISYLLGEGFDGLAGHLSSAYADGVAGRMSRLTTNFYKWSGLTGWTDGARAVSVRVIAAHLGQNADKAFADLDPSLRHVLTLNGITDAKWDALRSGDLRQSNGRSYMTPDVARYVDESHIEAIAADQIEAARQAILKPTKAGNITDAMQEKFAARRAAIIARARRDLELDLHRYYADETSYAVIETDAASRRLATGGGKVLGLTGTGSRPGTLGGEAIRFIMQFKGFPIAFSQRVLGRAILNAPKGRTHQAMHIGALMAGLTAAGYMSMTLKDMARGVWPPRDPLKTEPTIGGIPFPTTMGAAMMQGGALGIYGDFLFGTRSRFGSGPVETLSGPTVGTVTDVFKAWQDAREGNPKAGTYLDIAINNTPFINLFYTRAALDILFLNELREAAKPGYLRRQETNLKKDRGQTFAVPRTLEDALN
jgi:hypothetical protein